MLIVMGAAGGIDVKIETGILQVYAQASSYAENILGGVRTLHAFSLRPRVMAKYDSYLQDAYNRGIKKNKLYGIVFGGQYFVIYAGMGLAFWQGVAMIDRGEVSDLGTVFMSVFVLSHSRKRCYSISTRNIKLTTIPVFYSLSLWLPVQLCKSCRTWSPLVVQQRQLRKCSLSLIESLRSTPFKTQGTKRIMFPGPSVWKA